MAVGEGCAGTGPGRMAPVEGPVGKEGKCMSWASLLASCAARMSAIILEG